MEAMGEMGFINNGVQQVFEIPLSDQKSMVNETSFVHDGATVHLRFASDGKKLEDLLINYFKSLK